MKKYGKIALGAMTLMGALALASCGDKSNEAEEALKSVLVPQDKTVVSKDFSVTRHVKSGENNYEVIWTSSNEKLLKFVDVEGQNVATADIHAPFDQDEDVEFTATINAGKRTASQNFKVTVKNVDLDAALAAALASVKVDNFKDSSTYELPTNYTEYKDEISFSYSLEGTSTTTTLNNNVLNVTVGTGIETVKLNVKATAGGKENSKVAMFRVGSVAETVIELNPSNVKTGVGGLTLNGVAENTKFPVEFNINKGGSIASNGLTNITTVVATIYGTYDNMKMYAGKDATGTEITPEKEAYSEGKNTGMKYTYTFPEGTNDFYYVNNSTYTVNPYSIKVTCFMEATEKNLSLNPTSLKSGVSGLILTNVAENTKYPSEFNISKGGSIASDGIGGLTKVVATIYGTYDNMKMYAGKDATGTLIAAEKEAYSEGKNTGTKYTYTFPEGTTDFYYVNDSTHTVNPFSVDVYYTGLLNPTQKPSTPETPTKPAYTKLDNPTSSLLKGKSAGDAFSVDACKVGAISKKDSLLFCYTAEGTFAVTYYGSDDLKATCEALNIGDTIKITSATLALGTGGSVKGSITVGNDAQIEKIDDQEIAYPTFTAIDWSKDGYNWLASLTSDALAGSYVEFTNVKFQSVYNDGDQDLYSKFVFVVDGQTDYAGLYQGPLTVDGTDEKVNTTDTYTIKCFVIGAGVYDAKGVSNKVRLYAVSIVKNA